MLPTLAPQNMTEAMEFSKILATSNMVPVAYKGKPQDILVAIGWGYEVGLQPMQALQNIAVINGKPSVYGDAALALVKADQRCAGVKEWIEGEGDDMTAHCLVKRRYNEDIEETVATFSVLDAKQARLWGKQGPWQQYPKRMLAMRARGFAIRDAFPDAMKGMITAEEAQDYPAQTRDVTPKANPLDAIKPPVAPIPEAPESIDPPLAPDLDKQEATEVQINESAENNENQKLDEFGLPPLPNEDALVVQLHDATQYKDAFETAEQSGGALIHLVKLYVKNTHNRQGDEIPARERMTMIKALRDNNRIVIEHMIPPHAKEFGELYIKALRTLGAQLAD
tara:strand:+ start:228 stop:1241 length:1014 start_codon:yes stop_codon:yes gene_type:complete